MKRPRGCFAAFWKIEQCSGRKMHCMLLKNMESDHWVRRKPDAADGRVRRLELTAAGRVRAKRASYQGRRVPSYEQKLPVSLATNRSAERSRSRAASSAGRPIWAPRNGSDNRDATVPG